MVDFRRGVVDFTLLYEGQMQRLNIDMKVPILITDGESKFYDGIENKTLFNDGDEYTAYWTNGEKVTTCTTYATDKYTAEDELKDILIEYWLKCNGTARIKAAYRAIRHASMSELCAIINRVKRELTARERMERRKKRLPLRDGAQRIKDIHKQFLE